MKTATLWKMALTTLTLMATGCGPGSDSALVVDDDEAVGSSESELLGKRDCDANFTLDEVQFTGFVGLGEVKGLNRKKKCAELAIAAGPSFLRGLLLDSGFQEKANRPSSVPRLNSNISFECGQSLEMYADTRVEGKTHTRDVTFPVVVDCEALGIEPIKN